MPCWDAGAPRRKTKSVVLITDSIFIPPCVKYNPFAQRHIACPEDKVVEKTAADKILGVLKAGQRPKIDRQSAVNVILHSPRRATNADGALTPKVVNTVPDDLSVSDWTDCDEEEFDSLPVRQPMHAH